jgi:hypothetical protein
MKVIGITPAPVDQSDGGSPSAFSGASAILVVVILPRPWSSRVLSSLLFLLMVMFGLLLWLLVGANAATSPVLLFSLVGVVVGVNRIAATCSVDGAVIAYRSTLRRCRSRSPADPACRLMSARNGSASSSEAPTTPASTSPAPDAA